jgi:hypothetical protein
VRTQLTLETKLLQAIERFLVSHVNDCTPSYVLHHSGISTADARMLSQSRRARCLC